MPASSLPVGRLLRCLLRFWWMPVLTLLLGLAGGLAWVHWSEPVFVSKASMWETVKMRLPDSALFSEDLQNVIGTQTELLQSRTLREASLAWLRSSTNGVPPIPLGKNALPLPVSIRVSASGKSSVFSIEASSANQLFTQTYLDALMQTYLDYKKNIRKVISGDTLASITEQVQHWERDLKIEQDALMSYERTNNLAILQEEGMVQGGYLARLKTQLSDLELEARLLNAAAQEPHPSAVPLAASASAPAPAAEATAPGQALSQEVELLRMQRDQLRLLLRPQHPRMLKLEASIQRAEKMREIYTRQTHEQWTAARQANRVKMENLLASIAEWETRVVSSNTRLAEAQRLKLNVQRVQSVYDRLVLMVQNVGISRNIDQESFAILEPASPAKRSYLREQSGFALASAGGLVMGLGLAVLLGFRDDRFTSASEVNSALGDALVGMLPQVRRNGEAALPLLALDDPRHGYAESYRSLRSALLFQGTPGQRPKTLLIASAMPHEGKSTVSLNLARTLALAGSRVLLVDGDLRKGHLHLGLNLKSHPGFAELLLSTTSPAAALQRDILPNLFFIARGACPVHPGDLFLSPALDALLKRWRADYDYVVMDSSPVFAADDVSCLAPKVDGTLFIVRNHQSSSRAVREALDLLARRQARLLGVIYNGADATAHSYHYYKYADYQFTGKTA